MSHFPREKFARFGWCLPNLENQQKRQLVALLCFIEGMSIIFGFRCTKLLQIKVQFSRTPPWRIDAKFKDFLFLKEEVLGFPPLSSWDPTRYVPGTSFKPHMMVYQIIAEVYADPMEHISWRPVELVSTHQAYCSPQRKVIYEGVQPLWEPNPKHLWDLPSQWMKVLNT